MVLGVHLGSNGLVPLADQHVHIYVAFPGNSRMEAATCAGERDLVRRAVTPPRPALSSSAPAQPLLTLALPKFDQVA
jgi:hypothetical protein